MAKDVKEVKEVKPKLKVKLVCVDDYLNRAKDLFGDTDFWKNAIALIYTEHKVIDKVAHRKYGVEYFVVEI